MLLKDCEDHYENIAVCIDDLLIASKNPKGLVDILTRKHEFKIKCTGPMSCHLCCDFSRDDNGALRFSPRKYIEKMIDFHISIFGSKPKLNVMTPL